MAAVVNGCPGRKARSQEGDRPGRRVLGGTSGDQGRRPVSAPPEDLWEGGREGAGADVVQDLLARLPPSPELLQHYQAKLAQYEAEEKELAARVEACSRLFDNSNALERELVGRDREIEKLQLVVEEASIKLHEERRKCLQIGAENDRLRIRDIENQQKIAVLTRLSGKADTEVIDLVNTAPRLPSRSQEGSEKMAKFHERAKLKQKRSSHSLELEVEHLEQQLVEQEKLHKEQLVEERITRKSAEKVSRTDKAGLRERIAALQSSTAGLENHLQVLTTELANTRSSHRKVENVWSNEKAVLIRKVQFLEKFGTLEGTHSSHRAKARFAVDRKQQARLEKLEQEVEGKERELEAGRRKIVQLREEILAERSKSEAAAGILAKKTKAMAEQVGVLTERSEKTEVRRARESEGYQADIRLLRSKMCQLEDKLLAITAACTQDRNNEALLEQLRQELKVVEKRKPRQWKE